MIALIAALALAPPLAAGPPAPGPPVECPAGSDRAAFQCRAVAASAAGRFAEAADAFDHAAATLAVTDPDFQRLSAAAGNAWIAAGQAGKAAVALDRALAGGGLLADERGLAQLDRARAAEAQGDLKTARRFADLAQQGAGEDSFTWYFSAALALRENDLPAARAAIQRALALDHNDPAILFEAGHIARAEGKTAEARQYWQRAEAADPAGAVGKAAREVLAMVDLAPAVPISGNKPAPRTKAASPRKKDHK